MKYLKKLKKFAFKSLGFLGLALISCATPQAKAQDPYITQDFLLSAITPTTLISNVPVVVTKIYFKNSTATNATIKFYDSINGGTNYVQPATVSYSTIATNWSTVFTNATGILITNTFTGVATVGTTVSASTNELKNGVSVLCLASGERTRETVWQPVRGVTVYSPVAGLVELTYRKLNQ